ncbi:MAG: 16S rRNA (cytidine(1402)-2'-O)-methyltransferase [Nitrospinaceae bacterium]
MAERGKGTLFVVSTPIGHLGDMTYRAVETLGAVNVIAAEDTRRTRILLNHYGLKTPLSSFNSYNQAAKSREFLRRLNAGRDVALVSDAGTPGVSDPLTHLVQAALEQEVVVTPIPGASALLAAVTVSGIPASRFVFQGFLPRKKRRTRTLELLASQPFTVVIFESPHRLEKTLADLLTAFGNRPAAIARELTKKFEEVNRGTLEDLILAHRGRQWKGEITLVIAGQDFKDTEKDTRDTE